MNNGPRFIPIRLIWVCLMLGLTGCRDGEFEPPPPPAVTVATPVQREVTEYVEYTGTTSAFTEADIYARVSGYLESVHFNGSDDVKQGQLLYTIDQAVYIAARDKAKGEWQSRQADLKLATNKLNAIRNAHDNDSATDLELWQGEAEVQLATAQVAAAKASLELAELDLSFTEVKAPFDGRISETFVDPGNLIGDGDRTKMATLVQYKPMHVYFDVPERDLLLILEDSDRVKDKPKEDRIPLSLVLADGRELAETGIADYTDPVVDSATGTLKVRAVFANENKHLYPGLFVRVRAPIRTEPRLLVPQSALQRDLSGYFLMILGEKQVEAEDGTKSTIQIAIKRNIKVGVLQGELRVINEGITDGDQIIVVGIQRARDDGPVTPERGEIDENGEVIRPGVSASPRTPRDDDTSQQPAGRADEPKGE